MKRWAQTALPLTVASPTPRADIYSLAETILSPRAKSVRRYRAGRWQGSSLSFSLSLMPIHRAPIQAAESRRPVDQRPRTPSRVTPALVQTVTPHS